MAQNPLFPETTFPDSFQNIAQFLDVTSSDATLLTNFYNAVLAGDMATATQIYNTIPNADQKGLTAQRFNVIRATILALEQFYKTDITPTITQKQAEWQNILSLFSYVGVYSPVAQYEKNNMVSYTSNGLTQMYICTLKPPVGTSPLVSPYWRVFTIRGTKGDAGQSANFGFEWNSATPYDIDTVVVYENAWWISTQANTNQAPFQGSAYWQLVLYVKQALYPVTASQPQNQSVGELWFRVVT